MKAISSWFNSLTTNDRHASRTRSPYDPSFTSIRTGLTSDTSVNKSVLYSTYDASPNSSQLNLASSGSTAYKPGLYRRDTAMSFASSNGQPQLYPHGQATGIGNPSGGMQMQDFRDGVAPPPNVADSWRRIDRWCEDNYYELFDRLAYGATENDVSELEHELESSLPADVRESLYIHDGQERGGRPTGLFFGIALLDCEEIVDEYNIWKKVASQLPRQIDYQQPLAQNAVPGGSALSSRRGSQLNNSRADVNEHSSAPAASGSTETTPRASSRQQSRPGAAPGAVRQSRQASRPEGAIQLTYSHPGWIPLAKDFNGNNIAVDLSPGPKGKWGQIILFGADCDVKYVVASSWAAFLAQFVSDLESDRATVEDGDGGVGGEFGVLRYVVDQDRDYPYMETLRARVRRRERAERAWQQPRGSSQQRPNGKGRMSPATIPNENGGLPRTTLQPKTGTVGAPAGMSLGNSTRDMLTSPITSPKLDGAEAATNGSLVIDAKEKIAASAATPAAATESTADALAPAIDSTTAPVKLADAAVTTDKSETAVKATAIPEAQTAQP
ncbi:Cell wall assembly regulator [Savitreella phatthalungensis]